MKKVRLYFETDKILREVCSPVSKDVYERLEIASGMIKVFNLHKNGLGFAAPQAGFSKRAVLVKKKNGSLVVMYNPKILLKSIFKRRSNEACLSFRHRYIVRRHIWVVLMFEDIDGKKHIDFCPYKKSRVVEHEVDHLDGICIDKGRKVQ